MQETKNAHSLADFRQGSHEILALSPSNDCLVNLRIIRSVVAADHNSCKPFYEELSQRLREKQFDILRILFDVVRQQPIEGYCFKLPAPQRFEWQPCTVDVWQ